MRYASYIGFGSPAATASLLISSRSACKVGEVEDLDRADDVRVVQDVADGERGLLALRRVVVEVLDVVAGDGELVGVGRGTARPSCWRRRVSAASGMRRYSPKAKSSGPATFVKVTFEV